MTGNTMRHLASGTLFAGAMLIGACADEAPIEPHFSAPTAAQMSAVPDLGACQNLQVAAGHRLAFHVYAEGVQVYRWNGTSWSFVGPVAELYADAGGRGVVGSHYGGPTWESKSGSKVVGRVLERCTPDPTAIPWLLLEAASTQGPGIFHRISFIQRVNTVAGNAPASAGSTVGEEAHIPYTTEYYFYRPK